MFSVKEWTLLLELIEKTKLVEGYLIPILQHSDFPRMQLREFKRRWRLASLRSMSIAQLREMLRDKKQEFYINEPREVLIARILLAEFEHVP